MQRWYGLDGHSCAMPDGCSATGDAEETLEYLKSNFRFTNVFFLSLRFSFFKTIFLNIAKQFKLPELLDFLSGKHKTRDAVFASFVSKVSWGSRVHENRFTTDIPFLLSLLKIKYSVKRQMDLCSSPTSFLC